MNFDRGYVNMLRLNGNYKAAHAYCLEHITDPDALAEIAFDYHHGLAVKQDHEKGVFYDQLSAEGESAQGIYQLGKDYLSRHSNEHAREQAEILIRKAADLGWIEAKLLLGQMILHSKFPAFRTKAERIQAASELFLECSDAGDLRGTVYLAICKAVTVTGKRLHSHARFMPYRVFQSSHHILSAVAKPDVCDKVISVSSVHPSRWTHRRSAFQSTSTVQILYLLGSDSRASRRNAVELRNRIMREIETRLPRGRY